MALSLGRLIRLRRRELGLTQEVLAERAALSVQAIGAMERGERLRPREDTLSRLVDALDLTGQRRAELITAAARRPAMTRIAAESNPAGTTPHQLPPAVPHFVGRGEPVKTIIGLVRRSTAVVPAISGMAGVGKTALAVYAGHRIAGQFPDGQLYLNLRGYGGGEPMQCRDAMNYLLLALGERVDDVPADTEHAAAWYRSRLAGRRVLLVLDNAADAEQVAPLLPGTAGCTAIVTSRRALTALPQLRHLPLEPLSERESIELLTATVGQSRVDAEPDAVVAVARRCGRLPLAVHLAAARLAARPRWPIAHLARRLEHEQHRLDELAHDHLGVRASLAVSVEQLATSPNQLDRVAGSAFLMLGVPNLAEVSLPVATQLLGWAADRTEGVLEHLVDLSLLESSAPGWYHLHDLVRAHANELARAGLTAEDRAAALTRILELYTGVSWRGQALLNPGSTRTALADERWFVAAPAFRDANEAFIWLDAHRAHLLGIVRHAARDTTVSHELIVRLAVGMFGYFATRRHTPDWVMICQLAVGRAGADRALQATARMDLGLALSYLATDGRAEWDDCVDHFTRSLQDFRSAGHQPLVAACLMNFAVALDAKGDLENATRYAEQSLAVNQELSNHHGVAAASMTLGDLHHKSGHHDWALEHYQNCLAVSERIDFPCGAAGALHGSGVVHRDNGRHRESEQDLRRSIELFRQIGDPEGETTAPEELASLLTGLGNHRAAKDTLLRALDLAEQCGSPQRAADLRQRLAISPIA